MKCLVCGRWHWRVICKTCLDSIPLRLSIRKLTDSVSVYSFYAYSDVSLLMQSKYQLIGSRILKLLAQRAAKHFFTEIACRDFGEAIRLVGLDDYPYGAYSHTGIIVRAFERESKGAFKGVYGVLKARNAIKYAGESLAFRQSNPKGFCLSRDVSYPFVVLVDDIITTGTSFKEAINVYSSLLPDSRVVFCLSLCDARE